MWPSYGLPWSARAPEIRLPLSVLAISTLIPNSYGCLALADAVHLRCVKAAELALPVRRLALAGLAYDGLGLVQGLTQRLPHGRPMALAIRYSLRCGRPTRLL